MFFFNRLAFIGRSFLSPTCLHWLVYCHWCTCIFIAMQNLYFVPCRMSWCLSSYFCITLRHDNIPLPLTYVQYSLRIPDLHYIYNKQRKGNIPYLFNFCTCPPLYVDPKFKKVKMWLYKHATKTLTIYIHLFEFRQSSSHLLFLPHKKSCLLQD